uniref:Uncharacterized protein n=1 Tax=Amazona collaria TaxID=241587 RepID=A0A8B9F315_9PSIT
GREGAHVRAASAPWAHWCAVRSTSWAKLWPHWVQVKGVPAAWVRRWILREPFWLKALPQSGQAKGRSPPWLRWCVARLLLQLKPFPQRAQAKGPPAAPSCGCGERLPPGRTSVAAVLGRSSAWVRWWLRRKRCSRKRFPQCWQEKGFSPLWMRWWVSRLGCWPKHSPHRMHLNSFSTSSSTWLWITSAFSSPRPSSPPGKAKGFSPAGDARSVMGARCPGERRQGGLQLRPLALVRGCGSPV